MMKRIALALLLAAPAVGAVTPPTDPTSPTYNADWWRYQRELLEELQSQGWRFTGSSGDEMQRLERRVRELEQRWENGD